MKAIAVQRGESRPRVIEKSRPVPEPGSNEVLVRTLRVGIDGTDHEVIEGNHGGFPEDENHLVLGHEAVGVVEEPNGTGLETGDVVVPTVRRPPETGRNRYFEAGEPDMAPAGEYVECGIAGAHGFMAEYFVAPAEFLVPVPRESAQYAFLVEPISNSEKALDLAWSSRSTFEWQPESAVVLGNGPLGLLTLAMLRREFDRTYCLGRRDRPDPTIDIIENLGAVYVDSRETAVAEIPATHEPMDLVYEATGYAKHAFECVDALGPNGVGVLLGIPGDWEFEIDGGRLHREFVLKNKALVGSVNSSVPHFEDARDSLATFPDWFLDALITGVYTPADVDTAFEDGDTDIKAVIEFEAP